MATYPKPPEVPGTVRLGPRDAARLAWYSAKGLAHSVRRATTIRGRAYALATLGLEAALAPVAVGAQAVLLADRRSHWYATESKDAVLAVTATRRGWNLHSHLSAQPGTGQGAALRALVVPVVVAAADRDGVPMYGGAADNRLARIYEAEVPDLVDSGPALQRGRQIHRAPQAAPDGGRRSIPAAAPPEAQSRHRGQDADAPAAPQSRNTEPAQDQNARAQLVDDVAAMRRANGFDSLPKLRATTTPPSRRANLSPSRGAEAELER